MFSFYRFKMRGSILLLGTIFMFVGYISADTLSIKSSILPVCKNPGEVAVSCTQQCQPTCDTITGAKAPETCVPDGKCTPGCDCLPGYFRNALKVCLKAESCLFPKANYQVVKCPNPCPGGTCETPEFQQCNATCKEYGCQCKPGRVKDEKGYCILLETCPPKCEGKNEVSSPCTDKCPLTCKGIISNNPEQQGCYPAPCVAGCNCASGFARNVNGVCVKPGNCRCGDPNAEVVKCPNPCPGGTCEEPENSSCKLRCKPYGCQCKKGFVKDSDGKCILISKCVPICKGPGEIAVSCKNQCQPTCDSITSNKPQEICVPDSQCIPGCDCLPGYFRNGYNICIKAESCLCPAAYNQVVQCPNPCPGGTCDTPEFLDCDAPCKEYGCQCKEGRVKDKQGNCVLLEYCPLKCEGKNEVSSLCRDFCPLTCKGIVSNKPEQQGCFPAPCVAGCNCALGFVRNVNDVCIKPGNCRCGDPNAEVVQCPSPCSGGTCELPEFSACTELCAPYGCQCKKEFVKDSTGKCVLLSECRS